MPGTATAAIWRCSGPAVPTRRLQATRGAVQWDPHPLWGERVSVPVSVPGLDPERLREFDPFSYRSPEEMRKLLEAQIIQGNYYNDLQCPGLDPDIYHAMDL